MKWLSYDAFINGDSIKRILSDRDSDHQESSVHSSQ